MKRNSLPGFAFVVTAAMLGTGSAAHAGAGSPLPRCDQNAFCVVSVDGISQEKTEPKDGLCYKTAKAAQDPKSDPGQECARKWPFVYPGDHVLVNVRRANLIHYGYDIAVNKEALAVVIPVVGVGELGNLQSLGENPKTAGQITASTISKSPQDQLQDLRSQYTALINQLFAVTSKATASIRRIDALTAQGNTVWRGVKNGFPVAYATEAKTFLDDLHGANRDDSTGQIQEIDSVISRALSLATDAEALAVSTEDANITKAASDVLVPAFNKVSSDAAGLRTSLQRTELVVLRWLDIIEAFPEATITKDFLVDRKSQSYTVTVTRKPLTQVAVATDQARSEAASGQAGQEPKPSTLATFAFEGHAWHRFNVSLGLAELGARDTSQFTVTPVVEGAEVKQFVRESDNQSFTTKPIALFGTYLRKVDNYDPDRPAALMVTLGTEVSASPDTFLAGLAWDFPSGFGLGFGVMEYKKSLLANGWRSGQEVPRKADGSPVITTVPTRKKNALGFYLSATVRPSIFNAFWRARKGP